MIQVPDSDELYEIEQVHQVFSDLSEPETVLERLLWAMLQQKNDDHGAVETSIDYAGRKLGDWFTLRQLNDAYQAHQCAYEGPPAKAWEEIARDHLNENHDNVYDVFPSAISLDRVAAALKMDNREEFIEDRYGFTHCFRPLDWNPET